MKPLVLRIEQNRLRRSTGIAAQAAVALARGELAEPSGLAVVDGKASLPAQFAALSRWPDGSVKWLLADFLVDLASREAKTLRLEQGEAPAGPRVRVDQGEGGVSIDTGVLTFRVPLSGASLIDAVECDGVRHAMTGVSPQIEAEDGRVCAISDAGREIKVEYEGPVRAVVRIDGEHRDGKGVRFMRYRARVTAFAGDRVVYVDYAFINCEAAAHTLVSRVTLSMTTDGAATCSYGGSTVASGWRLTAEADNRLRVHDTDGSAARPMPTRAEPQAIVVTAADGSGAAMSLSAFKQQFPKQWRATAEGADLDLWPAGAALKYPRGMGKMHELRVAFFGTAAQATDAAARLGMHEDVPRAAASAQELAATGAMRDLFVDGLPSKAYGRIEMAIKDTFINRDLFVGMLDYGDDVGWGYTHAGRGGVVEEGPEAGSRRPIFNNLEYDFPWVALQQYWRSGEDYYFEQARPSVLHMLHVDFLHDHDGVPADRPVEFTRRGVALHVTDHSGNSGWTPCHMWTGGMVNYYLLTGSCEALEKARTVGDSLNWFVHSEHATRCMDRPGRLSREYGWGLIAACDLYDGLGRVRDLDTATVFVDLIRRWEARDPRLCHTSFCIAVCLNGLARYLAIRDDKDAGALFDRLMKTLLDHFLLAQGLLGMNDTETRGGCYGRRWGHGISACRALAWAWKRTGDDRYLRLGVRELAYTLDSGIFRYYAFAAGLHTGIRRHGAGMTCDATDYRPVSMREIAQHVRDLYPLLEAAHEVGLLGKIDYPC